MISDILGQESDKWWNSTEKIDSMLNTLAKETSDFSEQAFYMLKMVCQICSERRDIWTASIVNKMLSQLEKILPQKPKMGDNGSQTIFPKLETITRNYFTFVPKIANKVPEPKFIEKISKQKSSQISSEPQEKFQDLLEVAELLYHYRGSEIFSKPQKGSVQNINSDPELRKILEIVELSYFNQGQFIPEDPEPI